jgi:CBS domain containing-hemolysin-like protein
MTEGLFLELAKLLAVAALVFANGFFVAAEFSLVSVRRTRVDELVAQGHRAAKIVRHAIDDPDRFIAATQLGITVASLGLGWIGEPALAHLVEPLLRWLPGQWIEAASHSVAVGIAFFIITFLHVVLGELAPKSVALQYPEQTAFIVARPTVLTENLFRPLIWLLNGAGNSVLRLVGLQAPSGHHLVHSVEELKMLVAASQRGGALEADQATMLKRVFEFAERRAYEVMVPRTEVVAVERSTSLREFLSIFDEHSHARFPVYEEDLDNIVGIVSVKAVLRCIADDPACLDQPVETLAGPMLAVPETGRVADLLDRMRAEQTQMALVIDEYGGTAGVVTLEQLLEEIVGRVSDELFRGKAAVRRLADGSYQVDAQVRVDELNETMGWAIPEHDEYETLAGFLLYRMRRVPQEGESSAHRNLHFRINRMKGPKIEEVNVSMKETEKASPSSPTQRGIEGERGG